MAVSFGLNSGINFGSASSLDNVFDGGGTAMGWMYPTGWGANNRGRLWNKASGTGPFNGWAIYISNFNNFLQFTCNFTTTAGVWSTPFNSIVLNNLYHWSVSYNSDSTSNDPLVTLNGVQQTLAKITPVGSRISDAIQDLMWANNYDIIRGFAGWMDDPRVYSRYLSLAEIQTIFYSGGNDRIVDGLVLRPGLEEGAPGSTSPSDGFVKDVSQYNHYTDQVGTLTYMASLVRRGRRV